MYKAQEPLNWFFRISVYFCFFRYIIIREIYGGSTGYVWTTYPVGETLCDRAFQTFYGKCWLKTSHGNHRDHRNLYVINSPCTNHYENQISVISVLSVWDYSCYKAGWGVKVGWLEVVRRLISGCYKAGLSVLYLWIRYVETSYKSNTKPYRISAFLGQSLNTQVMHIILRQQPTEY